MAKYVAADGPGPGLANYEPQMPGGGLKPVVSAVAAVTPPVRVFLAAPGSTDPASVLVTVADTEGGGKVLTLAHEYPDVKPEAGWVVSGRGVSLVVAAVDGPVLTCI